MKSVIRRLTVVLGTLALSTIAIAAVGSAPASASPVGCSATYFCFYADPNYSGGLGIVAGDNDNFNAFSTSTSNCGNGTWNDCVSSAYNDGSSCTVYLWSDAGYSGRLLAIDRNNGYSDLKTVGFDDQLSSNHWCTTG